VNGCVRSLVEEPTQRDGSPPLAAGKSDDTIRPGSSPGAPTWTTVAEAWGVWGEESREGRKYEGLIRSSFLVDADGRIREAWDQAAPERTVPLALEAISAA